MRPIAVALVATIALLVIAFSAVVGWGVGLILGSSCIPTIASAVAMTLIWVGVAVILEGI